MFTEQTLISLLEKERKKIRQKDGRVVEQVHHIIRENLFHQNNVLNNLKEYNKTFYLLQEEGLESEKIFSLSEIKSICIQYNLRFLDKRNFKNQLPVEAIEAITEVTKNRKNPLENLKLLGEAHIFRKTEKPIDPIIFAETDKGNYYLVYQWGNKVSWHRAISTYPFRTIENLAGTLVSFCILLALIIPQPWIMDTTAIPYWDLHRFALFFHLFILFGALTVFLMLSFRRSFTSITWEDEQL